MEFQPKPSGYEVDQPVQNETVKNVLGLVEAKLKYSLDIFRRQDWFRTSDGRKLFLTFYPEARPSEPALHGTITRVEEEPHHHQNAGIYTVYHINETDNGMTIEKDTKMVEGLVKDHSFARNINKDQLEKDVGLAEISESEARDVADMVNEAVWVDPIKSAYLDTRDF